MLSIAIVNSSLTIYLINNALIKAYNFCLFKMGSGSSKGNSDL